MQLDIFGMSWVFVLEGHPALQEEYDTHELAPSTMGFSRNEEEEE